MGSTEEFSVGEKVKEQVEYFLTTLLYIFSEGEASRVPTVVRWSAHSLKSSCSVIDHSDKMLLSPLLSINSCPVPVRIPCAHVSYTRFLETGSDATDCFMIR